MLIGSNATILDAVKRLLQLDNDIQVTGAVCSVADAPLEAVRPDVVLVDLQHLAAPKAAEQIRRRASQSTVAVLETLKDLPVSQFLNVVRTLGETQIGYPRHLRPLPASGRDMRELLSDRELEVVRLVAEGLSNKEISSQLSLSDKTVKNHISHVLAKLNLSARTQVAVHALRAGIV